MPSFEHQDSRSTAPPEQHNMDHKRRSRKLLLAFCDVLVIVISHLFALLLQHNLHIDAISPQEWQAMWFALPVDGALSLLIFWRLRLYQGVWTFASVQELINVLLATILVTWVQVGLLLVCWLICGPFVHFQPLFYVLQFFLLVTGVGGIRFAYRLLRYIHTLRDSEKRSNTVVMVIGAGSAGSAIIRELQTSSKMHYHIACVIDDNAYKWGSFIRNCKIEGGRDRIVELAQKYGVQEIMIAIPSASRKEISEIVDICKETDCTLKILPGMYQMINGDISVSKLRRVEVEDLLGRDPIRVDIDEILGYVQDKVVLVTGGGGSIGSELCRQIASHHPRQLVIFDIYENNAYDIQQELRRQYPDLSLEVLIGSVRNEQRVQSLFDTYHPDIVYHAAAHKHVPLMEDSPNEAIKNNVCGTYNVAQAAGQHHVRRFVLISTDKAVNPTNIMGASKRLCEMIIQMMNNRYDTEFVAVRFGNVLGSNGSVIPLFRKQIERGGPVTVTHPDIIRYFMTIPEAVSLVLQAGAYAKGGEIFVLDMGQPVRIADLARNLIRLSGYKPDVDIAIEYTGLRPGEKLYEEMLMDEEGISETENKLIYIGKPIQFDEQQLEQGIAMLKKAAYDETDHIRQMVAQLVPTYHPAVAQAASDAATGSLVQK